NSVTVDTNNTVTTLVDNTDGSFTYTSEDGSVTSFIGTDNQDLSLSGDNLSLTNDPTATTIDLSKYTETVVGAGTISVVDDGNGNYTVSSADPDESISNEVNTRFSVVGSNLEIEDDNSVLFVPLSELAAGGAVGPQGPIGDQGPDGDKGATGDKGADGDKGIDGDQGPIGAQGPDGDKGATG
ncbi:collagen-like protein, partial [Cellulophaga sp. F20128]|nr:collagen-like protein [Cellulophaga sp. F20128]